MSTEKSRETQWLEMLAIPGEELELVIARGTIQEGRSLSAEAIDTLSDQFLAFVCTRIVRRWDQTGEPPTVLRVEVKVIAQ